jgi:cytidylate kinase
MGAQLKSPAGVVITVDGPAASGKTSVSRDLAKEFNWKWVSTGMFYRGLAYVALQEKTSFEDPVALAKLADSSIWSVEMSPAETYVIYKNHKLTEEISQEEIGMHASQISQYPEVRKALLAAQRACARPEYVLVAEGRDCGTVVFPGAALKVYLTAHADSRALRRSLEKSENFQELKDLQRKRDQTDKQRTHAPLQIPEGAHVIDTSTMGQREVVLKIIDLIKAAGL